MFQVDAGLAAGQKCGVLALPGMQTWSFVVIRRASYTYGPIILSSPKVHVQKISNGLQKFAEVFQRHPTTLRRLSKAC